MTDSTSLGALGVVEESEAAVGFSRERRGRPRIGREGLVRAIRAGACRCRRSWDHPWSAKSPSRLFRRYGVSYESVDALSTTAIGEHHLSAESVAGKISKELRGAETGLRGRLIPPATRRHRRRPPGIGSASTSKASDDVMAHRPCCTPSTSDEIMGFVLGAAVVAPNRLRQRQLRGVAGRRSGRPAHRSVGRRLGGRLPATCW